MTRKDYILKCIVEYFIKKAEPIGSSTLIDEFNLDCSSATVRNVMAELEKDGLIEKTHTSSGRVPSNKGYSYYIKYLRNKDVDETYKNQLAKIFTEREKSIDDVIKESCAILSHMTNLASIVLGPEATEEHLVSVQAIPLSDKSLTCVFVTDKGYVENKTFVLNDQTSLKDIKECVAILNDRLVGASISELTSRMEMIKPLISEYVKSNDAIYRMIAETLLRFQEERVSMFGQSNLLNQPEFTQDADKLKRLLEFFEHPSKVNDVLKQKVKSSNDDFEVYIGDNNGYNDVSMITSNIKVGDKQLGKIALVGPTRMDYEKVLSALEYFVDQIEDLYEKRKEELDEER